MKLSAGLTVTALANLVAASTPEAANVYLLRPQADGSSSATSPQLPRQLVRQILFQRIGADYDSFSENTPHSYDENQALALIKSYGKRPPLLFEQPSKSRRQARQAALIVEGVTEGALKTIQEVLSKQPSFQIADPPSSQANEELLTTDLGHSKVARSKCGFNAAWEYPKPECWNQGTFIQKVDLNEDAAALKELASGLSALTKLADNGDVETLLILMPESSRSSSVNRWTTHPLSNLRSRSPQGEAVIAGHREADSKSKVEDSSPAPATHAFMAPKGAIPACFQSFNSCMDHTNNCTGNHGTCKDKYAMGGKPAAGDGGAKQPVCFACVCQATLTRPDKEGERNQYIYWGGNACQKQDISVQFWLIAGFTIVMIGAVSFAVSMLFSVGEEKLPGVIGAGVSKSK